MLPADPGIGSARAAVGSKEWAERVRLNSQPIIRDAQSYPEKARAYVETITKHRAWTLLNKRDGSSFKSFDEFCAEPQPYGWGIQRERLEALIRVVASEAGENPSKAVALATVAPAVEQARDEKGRVMPSGQVVPTDASADKEAKRLRAINRAPEPARDLFRSDLMSKGVAVALGTTARDIKPEKAAAIAEATAAAVAIVETKKPTTPAEKRKVRREVDAVVRERLGAKKPDPLDRVLGALKALERDALLRLRDEIDRLLKGDS